MKLLGSLSFVAMFALIACGGPAKPTNDADDVALVSSPNQTPPAPKAAPAGPPPSAELTKGIHDFDGGKYAEARADFEAALQKNPKDTEAGYNLGLSFEKLGLRDRAVKAYRDVLAEKADLEPASLALSALLIDMSDFDGAATVSRQAIEKHPSSAALNLNLGVALASGGDAKGARTALEAAVRGGSQNAQALLTLGHWLVQWKSPDSTATLLRAAAAGGSDIGVLASVGYELRMAGAFPECVRVFDQAIALHDGGEVRTERALCKLGQKDGDGALADLSFATTNDTSFAPGHYYLAGRMASSGKLKEAVAEYETYLKLAPNGSLAKAAADRLRAAKDALKKRH